MAPDFPIIDVHHHLWDESFGLAENFGRFLPQDFVSEVEESGHRLIGSVYGDCGFAFRDNGPEEFRCVGETEYVEQVAEHFSRNRGAAGKVACGIIARANLMMGDAVGPVLDAHREASPKRFKGIRELLAYDPEVFRALNIPQHKSRLPAFRSGVLQLARRGLILEVLGVHPMLDDIVDLAHAFPEVSIVLNHFGYPIGIGRFHGQRAAVFDDWRSKISALARCENITIKLSGVGAEVPGFGWFGGGAPARSVDVATVIEPYVTAAIDAFSPARCMFASNFPVDKASFSYGTLWNAFKRVAARYSLEEQHMLFHANATRIYRLEL
ncbi:amidohydrolase family protein [Sphingobium subterraneum]|uniref:amidohydrolase family protein n=1 Tax=Sphingobium subterraneum TaxID=627688 RepID=UPI00161F496F